MKILLINPNRYQFPPVVPVGLEYLAGILEDTHHEVEVLDLCFKDDPIHETEQAIKSVDPDIAGITIRQIDTVLYHNNEFFLEGIKKLVQVCKRLNVKVLLGGVGYSIMPGEILAFTGADYGIYGPGEPALLDFLNSMENGSQVPKVIDGSTYFTASQYSFTHKKTVDYEPYFKNEGIAGFRTQVGCNEHCVFCTEGKKKIIFHQPEAVGNDLARLNELGYNRFHLCDSEFNLDLDHCLHVCREIALKAPGIEWALYMKPNPVSKELFEVLKTSGANMLTLSVDTCSGKNFEKLAQFFLWAKQSGIRVAIDLSVGFPYEQIHHTKELTDFLSDQPVSTIGINSFYRVYPGTPLHALIRKDSSVHKYLINWKPDTDYIYPVFFNYFSLEQLRQLTADKPIFRIEGFEKATNYQRIRHKA